ncbi:hypothetical protein TCAP_02814 [Tolypocladium capitatum]|uniref:Uncharacterized protein n=1 Tax=Tolypocladium capitatum TaxID=45235 RepID=A0A2K3QI90_9HYPO|nr:hypothetical protein TCAP_02814 [Tolypocladium capitatum]
MASRRSAVGLSEHYVQCDIGPRVGPRGRAAASWVWDVLVRSQLGRLMHHARPRAASGWHWRDGFVWSCRTREDVVTAEARSTNTTSAGANLLMPSLSRNPVPCLIYQYYFIYTLSFTVQRHQLQNAVLHHHPLHPCRCRHGRQRQRQAPGERRGGRHDGQGRQRRPLQCGRSSP